MVRATMLSPVILATVLLLWNPVNGRQIGRRLGRAASRESQDADGTAEGNTGMVPGQGDAAKCKRPSSEGLRLVDDLYKKEFYDLGEKIKVKCTEGYAPVYYPMECIQRGTGYDWDVEEPCVNRCKHPVSEGLDVTIKPGKSFYDLGEQIYVTCAEGYQRAHNVMECIQKQCQQPSTSGTHMSFKPSEAWYDRQKWVYVTCSEGYQRSADYIQCRGNDQSIESGWDKPVTCIQQCRKPGTQDTILMLDPLQAWYNPGTTVAVACTWGYRPSTLEIVCKGNDQNSHSDWDRQVMCIQQCRKPYNAQMSLEPSKVLYDREVRVKVRCSEGYRPSTLTITCKEISGSSEVQWSETPSCIQQCRNPYKTHLSLEPHQDWYDREVTVTLMCSEGYRPSTPAIKCKEKYGYRESQWSETATCIQQCANPSTWDARVKVHNYKQWFDQQEMVRVTCSEGYLPSAPDIICRKKYPSSSSEWNVKVSCIQIKEERQQKTADSIRLTVSCNGKSCWTFWAISVTALQDSTCCEHTCPPSKNPRCQLETGDKKPATCTSLQPFTWYNVTIEGRDRDNPWNSTILSTAMVRTEALAPDAPETDGPMGEADDGAIYWKKLSDCKGTIEGYELKIISWRDYNITFGDTKHVTVNSSVTHYTVNSPGTNYTVTVRGFNEAGPGAASSWTFATKIKAPILPPIINTPGPNSSATATTFVLPLHPVSDHHGPISEYQVIVSRQGHGSDNICQMGGLAPYNRSLEQETYIAVALPAHNLTREFVVGDGTTRHGYFNPPLSADHNYTAFLRVISVWQEEKTQSCAKYGSIFTVSANPEALAMSPWLLAALVLLVLLLFLAAIVALFRLQRLRSKSSSGAINGLIPLKKQTHSGMSYSSFCQRVQKWWQEKAKTSIPVAKLLEVMKKFKQEEMTEEDDQNDRADTDKLAVGRYAEYQKLESGLQYPSEAGSALNNKSKNRYKNIIPYDHSRVVLRGRCGGEDYINASYIDGYKSPNSFIACQGPLPETVADFWQMVWQEKSSLIIMLTGLVEQNKVKCEQYWPEQSQMYEDIHVTLCSTQQCAGHTVRKLSIQKGDAPQRTVEHLHYLQWPDHGVPSKPASLLRLVELMNAKRSNDNQPIIVHCSAGIGRTGTFIALDILQKMALAERKVDVFRCTEQMRERRVNMIQTKEQYIFLYDALTEGVLCGLTAVTVERFQQHVRQLKVQDPVAKTNGFCKEFQKLERFSALYKQQSATQAKRAENRLKNRNPDILPADVNRPILMSILSQEGSPGYINAVFADSYDKEGHFIVTQLPLNETIAEFWSAVWDYRCTAIVMMNRIEDLDETYPFFWPETGELIFGPFTVKLNAELLGVGFTTRTLSVHKAGQSSVSELHIKLWQLDSWPIQQQPQNPAAIVSVLGEVATYRHNDSHVIVTCWDGASRSGLFVAASNICEQIREEGIADPSQAVRLLKSRRWQLIPDVDQYAFLHQLALLYLDSFETYGNFK